MKGIIKSSYNKGECREYFHIANKKRKMKYKHYLPTKASISRLDRLIENATKIQDGFLIL